MCVGIVFKIDSDKMIRFNFIMIVKFVFIVIFWISVRVGVDCICVGGKFVIEVLFFFRVFINILNNIK